VPALLGAVAWARGAEAAVAEPAKAACAHGAEEGQRLRAQGKLREAREAFTACAAERCPALIRSDCSGWLVEVEAALPTVVIRASAGEHQARELYDVEVRVDGVLLTTRLDGRELPVNPGEHHLSFSAAGRATAEDTVVIRVGEKHRLLTVSLPSVHTAAAPPTAVVPAPAPAPRPRVGTAARVLLIAGGVGLASAAAFGTSAWLDERSLRRGCAPACPEADVDSVRTRLRIADVSLAVGAAALAGAAVLIWTRSSEEGSGQPAARVGVTPLAGGAMVAVRFGSLESW
jgi:hypothetical protein